MSAIENIHDEDDYYEVKLPSENRRAKRMTSGLIVLIIVGASFYGGVYTQKHHGKTKTTTGARNAAAFGANRTGTGGTATRTGTNRTGTGTAATGTGNAPTGAPTGGGGFGGGGTNGTVTSVSGNDIYVTETSGNVVKITTSGSSTVSKTETGTVSDIKPGETIRVQGQAGDDGTVAATSISVGNSGATTGGPPVG